MVVLNNRYQYSVSNFLKSTGTLEHRSVSNISNRQIPWWIPLMKGGAQRTINHHLSTTGWRLTYPSEKWWRESQLGSWHSQLLMENKNHVPNHNQTKCIPMFHGSKPFLCHLAKHAAVVFRYFSSLRKNPHKGEIPTRLREWWDFLGANSWFCYPLVNVYITIENPPIL